MKKLSQILFSSFLLFLLSINLHSEESTDPQKKWSSYVNGNAKVVDGDTIIIKNLRIRLFGIDAPEKNQICKINSKAYNCGKSSTEALKRFIDDHRVLCTWKNLDIYGRPLAFCSVSRIDGSEIFLNGMMVATGNAVAYKKYSKKYLKTEKSARENREGIWQGEFDMPWDWRRKYK